MTNGRMFFAVVAMLSATYANAQDAVDGGSFGAFTCTPIAKFADATANTETIRINNFSIREGTTFLSGDASVLEVTYSVANRSDKPARISADFILYNELNLPIAAISAGPMLDTVQAGKTDSASGDTFVSPGVLKSAKSVCLRVYAYVG